MEAEQDFWDLISVLPNPWETNVELRNVLGGFTLTAYMVHTLIAQLPYALNYVYPSYTLL